MAIAKKAAAKKAAPAKSVVQATTTLKHLAAALADSHEIAKKQAEAVLGDLVTLRREATKSV
jgi:DNA-binding protein HU-beta